jgi:hypothetical protein
VEPSEEGGRLQELDGREEEEARGWRTDAEEGKEREWDSAGLRCSCD